MSAASVSERMPDLCTPTRGCTHTLDSALPTLVRVGVGAERVAVETAGGGWPPGQVLAQSPEPGTPLRPETRVRLVVAGFGGLESLPYPMRDEHPDEFRADRLFALFDSPLQKVAHHVRRAGGHLELQPGVRASALRWIEDLFHLDASVFADERLPALVRLLPVLHRVAGLEEGPRLALGLVFGLPVRAVVLESVARPLPDERRTRLGSTWTRLGVDAVAGSSTAAGLSVRLEIGPVGLETWLAHTGEALAAERAALLRLVLPAGLATAVEESWTVAAPGDGCRLGVGEVADAAPVRTPILLGINTHLEGA